MLNTKALMDRLGGKLSLPSLPEVVLRVQDLVAKPGTSIKEVGLLIGEDPPLTARILRIANSAYYGLSAPILDICHGAAILGLDTLQTVVLQVAVVDLFKHQGAAGAFKPKDLWAHSTLSAQIAGSVPRRGIQGINRTEAYVAGLLHDIGKFVMFEHLRDEYADAYMLSLGQGRAIWKVEEEVFGFNHAQVGELVMRRWALPDKAVRAVGRHHNEDLSENECPLVSLVAMADHIAQEVVLSKGSELQAAVPQLWIDRLRLKDSELEALVEKAFQFKAE